MLVYAIREKFMSSIRKIIRKKIINNYCNVPRNEIKIFISIVKLLKNTVYQLFEDCLLLSKLE
jgi:hypothetical protein